MSAPHAVGIGYSKGDIFKADCFSLSMGWFLGEDGCVWAEGNCRNYCPELSEGDVVTVQLDTEAATLSFAVNDAMYGIAADLVSCEHGSLLPCACFYGLGCVSLLE